MIYVISPRKWQFRLNNKSFEISWNLPYLCLIIKSMFSWELRLKICFKLKASTCKTLCLQEIPFFVKMTKSLRHRISSNLVLSNSRIKGSKGLSWNSLILIGFNWFIDLSGKYFGKYFDFKKKIRKIFQKIKCYEVLGSSLLPSSLPSTSYRGVRSSRS